MQKIEKTTLCVFRYKWQYYQRMEPVHNTHDVTIRYAPKSILPNPFKTYLRIGRVFFGVTFLVNMTSGILLDKAELSEKPFSYVFCVLCKSIYYIPMWPAIPIELITNPRAYYSLGGSFKE